MIPLTPPYVPAISTAATEYFESILLPSYDVFEWGTGGSTLWLAERVHHVVSIENVPAWQAYIAYCAAGAMLGNIQFLLFDWQKGRPNRDVMLFLYDHAIDAFPDESFDVVFSDGWDISRKGCAPLAVRKLKPGGWLVQDDTNWNPARWAIDGLREAGWEEVRRGGIIECAWDGQPRRSITSFFRKPE